MKHLRATLLALLMLIGVSAAMLALVPSLLLVPLANFYLDELGFELTSLGQLRLGTKSINALTATLESKQAKLSISGIELQYSMSELFRGQLRSLVIAQLNVQLLSLEPSNSQPGTSPSLTEMLRAVDNIPIADIVIGHITIESNSEQFDLELQWQTQPTRLVSKLVFNDSPKLQLELNAQRSGTDAIAGTMRLKFNNQLALESDFELAVLAESIGLKVQSTAHLDALTEFPDIAAALAPFTISTNSLYLDSQLTVQSLFERPAISELRLTIDSPNSVFHIAQQSVATTSDIKIHLPLLLVGAADSIDAGIELSATTDIHFTASLVDRAGEAHFESTLAGANFVCSSTTSCAANAQWEALGSKLRISDIQVESMVITAAVNIDYTENELYLSIPSLELSIPTASTPVANGGMNLTLQNIEFNIGEQVSGSFAFFSNEISPEIENITVNNPTIVGALDFQENTLHGSIALRVNNQLEINAVFQHQLTDSSGSAELQLPQYSFSSITPLSSMVNLTLFNTDIVAGNVSAEAQLWWKRQSDKRWNIGGPVSLKLQNFSGFYQGNFFVDLNTEITGEVTDPFGLRSNGDLSATIATIDVGLPMSNIEWQYRFDTSAMQFRVEGLNIEVLGGSVSVPEFDYDATQDENELGIVLTGLNLASIVNLADYPALVVEGLISGYLPLRLSGDRFTIEQGLVAALNPGGSIRYTPANSVPSSNPSIKLVNDALSNYQFETLNTEVFYDENGDLRMEIQLQGINPDMNDGQAINVNINITDNIPTLLRSLQASRVITDALEQRLRGKN